MQKDYVVELTIAYKNLTERQTSYKSWEDALKHLNELASIIGTCKETEKLGNLIKVRKEKNKFETLEIPAYIELSPDNAGLIVPLQFQKDDYTGLLKTLYDASLSAMTFLGEPKKYSYGNFLQIRVAGPDLCNASEMIKYLMENPQELCEAAVVLAPEIHLAPYMKKKEPARISKPKKDGGEQGKIREAINNYSGKNSSFMSSDLIAALHEECGHIKNFKQKIYIELNSQKRKGVLTKEEDGTYRLNGSVSSSVPSASQEVNQMPHKSSAGDSAPLPDNSGKECGQERSQTPIKEYIMSGINENGSITLEQLKTKGYTDNQIRNTLFQLKKAGEIKNSEKGRYTSSMACSDEEFEPDVKKN